MDVKKAITRTMQLADAVAHSRDPNLSLFHFRHPSLGYVHVTEMHHRCMTEEFDNEKLHRWLAWMQAAIVSWAGSATVEDMKRINKES
jgi:hypothetical protein